MSELQGEPTQEQIEKVADSIIELTRPIWERALQGMLMAALQQSFYQIKEIDDETCCMVHGPAAIDNCPKGIQDKIRNREFGSIADYVNETLDYYTGEIVNESYPVTYREHFQEFLWNFFYNSYSVLFDACKYVGPEDTFSDEPSYSFIQATTTVELLTDQDKLKNYLSGPDNMH